MESVLESILESVLKSVLLEKKLNFMVSRNFRQGHLQVDHAPLCIVRHAGLHVDFSSTNFFFWPMRALTLPWSRVFSLVCEVALNHHCNTTYILDFGWVMNKQSCEYICDLIVTGDNLHGSTCNLFANNLHPNCTYQCSLHPPDHRLSQAPFARALEALFPLSLLPSSSLFPSPSPSPSLPVGGSHNSRHHGN
jgi:hypothetical protein